VLDSSGNLLSENRKPVEDAIENYIDNIRYGGAFGRTKSIDAIQSVNGVVDAVLLSVELNGVAINAQSFESASGFFNIEALNITYPAIYEY
jgi:hypothetical protein